MSDRPQKITFAQMRNGGGRGLLICCSDYRCNTLVTLSGDRWPVDIRLSDLEPQFVCWAYGKRGTDVRSHFNRNKSPLQMMGCR
jgi:hypothetical protein